MMKGRFLTQEIISDFKEHKDFADFFMTIFPILFRYCNIGNIPPIFFLALLYPECTVFLPNLHTRQKHGTATDALRKS